MLLTRLRVACLQTNAGKDWEKNWKQAESLLIRASDAGAQIAALPENFLLRASEKETDWIAPQIFAEALVRLKKSAIRLRLTLVAGSLLEPLSRAGKPGQPKYANASFVISSSGQVLLHYRKMHLFDINLPGVRVMESKTIAPGKEPGFFKWKGISAGVGICYDLRFPEYFRVLSRRGAELIFVPANFTAETGKTAWEVLLRARAIENQCFVIAPGQCGRHPGSGIVSYGNSLMIDPLGRVLERASFKTPQLLIHDLQMGEMRRFRRLFPVLKHRKLSV